MYTTLRSLPLICLLVSGNLFGQTTITLQPGSSGKDAYIDSRLHTGNYPGHIDFPAIAWTVSGTPVTCRALIAFDYSAIPPGATILSAYLTLYAYDSPLNQSHSTLSGANTSYIRRVIEPWDENTVTWDNQPASTAIGQLTIPSSNAITNISNLNVTDMVEEMLVSGNNGFILQLATESYYRKMIYASSDNPDASLHPKLVITYASDGGGGDDIICNTLRLTPEGKDAYTDSRLFNNNYGNDDEISAIAWTNGGDPTDCRSFFEFDLSNIPAGAPLVSAELTLHAFDSPSNGAHSTLSGPNTSYIRRVIEPWSESTVTWANQPATTSSDQRIIPSSSVMTDISNLDVMSMVQTMLTGGNYGFALQLADENHYRQMIYASGDNPVASLRPTLEICYRNQTNSIGDPGDIPGTFALFPNPSDGVFHLQRSGGYQEYAFSVWSVTGQKVRELTSSDELVTIDLSQAEAGVYFIHIQNTAGKEVIDVLVR